MNKQKFGSDNWLYILTNALANYQEEGGQLAVEAGSEGLTIYFRNLQPQDRRLHPAFVQLIRPMTGVGEGETGL